MRSAYTLAALAALGLGAPSPARAQYGSPWQGYNQQHVALVDHYYRTYLGRSGVDDPNIRFWLDKLNEGQSAESVEAAVLGCDEYYFRTGSNLDTWVRAVYRDAMGRQATPREADFWSRRAYTQGLVSIAGEILAQRTRANVPPAQPGPAPVQNWQQPQQNYDYRQPSYPYRR